MTKIFRLTLTMDHPIIKEHTVYEQPLLPGLAYIDLIYQLAEQLDLRHQGYMLKRLSILNPLTISFDRPVPLVIIFEEKKDLWEIRVESEFQNKEENVVYTSAELHPAEVDFNEIIDLDGLQENSNHHFELEKVYEQAREQGLLHGGAIKAEGNVYQDEKGILIAIKVAENHQQDAERFLFHPALIDGSAMAAGALWEQAGQDGELYIPLHYDSFYCIEPIQTTIYVRAPISSVKKVNDISSLDMFFYNGEGKQIGQLLGVTSKKIRDKRQINSTLKEDIQPSFEREEEATTIEQAKQPVKESRKKTLFENMLRDIFSRYIDIPSIKVNINEGYFELGLQSSQLLAISQELESKLDVELSPTLFFEYSTIQELSFYLAENIPLPSEWEEPEEEVDDNNADLLADVAQKVTTKELDEINEIDETVELDEDIAIIGMGGRFPGASNIAEFWDNLVSGTDCITEIPSSRWDWKEYSQITSPSGKSISRWGGFIDNVDYFDPYFFNITPREAEILDPQERLFLEVCWESIEDAGYVPQTLTADSNGEQSLPVGVFVGVMHKDYTLIGAEAAAKGAQIPLSLNYAPIANRVSYFCNFNGPSMAVDTVCSSSLVSVHLAIDSIHKGESEVALAGGVNLSLHPNKYLTYGMANMHSTDGYCNTFGEGGDGYVSSDGVGVVLLKSLSKAKRDKDHIYAVIKGSSINHGGKANGITVPNPVAQGNLIASCLAKTKIDPRTISYVEAHGTGTSLGDPIEIQGLIRAYRQYTSDNQYCAIGSVKSNIGHAESAAGISGLIKNALQLYHKTLVPSLHSEELNPYIKFEESPFYVQHQSEYWDEPTIKNGVDTITLPRRAGLSSFGATGTNVHMIMEERPVSTMQGEASITQKLLIPLSAKSEGQLFTYGQRVLTYLEHLEESEQPQLKDIAYTLQVGRVALENRIAFVAKNLDDFRKKLKNFLDGEDKQLGIYRGNIQQRDELLDLLTEDEDGQDVVQKWRQKGKLHHIARLWVSGMDVDWYSFYTKDKPNRISLPTYPFKRESFWIPTVPNATEKQTFLHPLLHQNTSDFSGVQFSSHFTGREKLLNECTVKGFPTLPFSSFIEMVYNAILKAGGEEITELTQVILKEVVILNSVLIDTSLIEIDLRLFMGEQEGIDFVVFSNKNQDEPICRGKALIHLPTEQPKVNIEKLVTNSQEINTNLEKSLNSLGIAFDQEYQVIKEAYKSSDQVMLKFHQPQVSEQERENLLTNPFLLNASLQIARVILEDASFQDKQFFLQSETIEYFQASNPEWAVITPNYSHGKWDLQLCTVDGNVCARMTNIHWIYDEKLHVEESDTLSGDDEVMMMSSAYESQMESLQSLIPNISLPEVTGRDSLKSN